ncbi:hypothetical protein [Idiomarina sp. HP20-50]|uniref:hypothetical protein n=1 Tax=Idiomarina sp. HP20-50 TaxID=3070813 RepID=UPI00294B7426|nr:hypothetical protein [Idiomarina sp. HP20-50]MDV6314820.1 hypothetical protein [Idiomarina sp. HP20-50]
MYNRAIEHAFEELAQSLRVLLEADFRANQDGLLLIDRAEAIGNIENALSSVLNAFHSLYDAIEKQLDNHPINWYESAPLAIVLAIRNARHHNKANRIRTLYTYHTQEAEYVQRMERYVLVDFVTPDEGADTFDVYMSWSDLKFLLNMPPNESRIRKSTSIAIREYLDTEKFPEYSSYYDLEESRVFFNIVPLLVNAAATIVPLIKQYCGSGSTESAFFAEHFSTVIHADTSHHDVNCGPFALVK